MPIDLYRADHRLVDSAAGMAISIDLELNNRWACQVWRKKELGWNPIGLWLHADDIFVADLLVFTVDQAMETELIDWSDDEKQALDRLRSRAKKLSGYSGP